MKKLAIILLGLFPLVLSSCLKEEEDYFDKSASARIEEAVKNAISVLEGAENGWAVKYYPNPTQTFGGFNLFFKFDDGTVTVSSEIESASTTATSLYSVGQEAGPTLAIDTKNELINYFAHPRNPDGYGSNYKGLEGDYLWTVLSATPEKVMLRGVKSGSLYTLTPLETSDWASEMQAYKNAASDMEFPSYVCVVKGDSLECITTSEGKFLYRNLTIRQETDKGIESYAAPFIYTKTGIELYEPLTINGVTAQKLDLKEEYYFANEDDSFIISGPKPVTSDNILTYGAVETTFNTVKVTVTPSNSDTYYVAAFLPSEIAGYTDKQLRNAICDLLAAGDLYSGEKTLTFNYLYDQAEYILVGFGIDATTMASTTKIFRPERDDGHTAGYDGRRVQGMAGYMDCHIDLVREIEDRVQLRHRNSSEDDRRHLSRTGMGLYGHQGRLRSRCELRQFDQRLPVVQTRGRHARRRRGTDAAPAYPQPPDKRLRAAQHECVPALRETGRGRQGQHHGP